MASRNDGPKLWKNARGVILPASVRRWFLEKADPLTNLFLVLPLFAVYHLGVLALMRRGPNGGYQWVGNGVDFLTATLLNLGGGSIKVYAAITAGVTVVLGGLLMWARRKAELHPRMFAPMLLESALWAVALAMVVGSAVSALGLGVLDQEGLAAQIVASCGAGLHEELVFRMGLFHGMGYLLAKQGRARPWVGWLAAVMFSSVLFAGVHYLGPMGDRWQWSSFVFRLFMGVTLAGIYRLRGFAIAAWSHALYDILYFTLRAG